MQDRVYQRCEHSVPTAHNKPTGKTECVIIVSAVFPQPTTNLPTSQCVPAVLALCPHTLACKTENVSHVSAESPQQQQTYRQDSVSSSIGDVSPHAYLLDSVPAVSALCLYSQNILTCKPECVIGVRAVPPQPTTNLPVRQGVSAVLALCPRSLPQTYLQDKVYLRW